MISYFHFHFVITLFLDGGGGGAGFFEGFRVCRYFVRISFGFCGPSLCAKGLGASASLCNVNGSWLVFHQAP